MVSSVMDPARSFRRIGLVQPSDPDGEYRGLPATALLMARSHVAALPPGDTIERDLSKIRRQAAASGAFPNSL
jgi:hypothetical protein